MRLVKLADLSELCRSGLQLRKSQTELNTLVGVLGCDRAKLQNSAVETFVIS